MGRLNRSQLLGPYHHVFNRGARHLPIFGDDDDRAHYLRLISRFFHAPVVHAYALMGNHYHLLVEGDVTELSAAMKGLGENYTRRFNRKYGFDGPLFRSRYRSKPITNVAYLRHAVRYIHRNPVVDGLGDWSYPWSSHPSYVAEESHPSWLSLRLLTEFGGRTSYREFVEADDAFPASGPAGQPSAPVRVDAPAAVEFALGIASPSERDVLASGGRGLRNDIRVAAVLLATESTGWSSERLAARYGYSSGSSLRTAVVRARRRLRSDPQFASLVGHARQRMTRRHSSEM